MSTSPEGTIKGYDLMELIGEGSYSAVYRARQSVVDREVAIKIILPEFANQPDFIRRFETEAQLVAQLEHLHIVPLYDYWRDPDGAYLVMRQLKGGSLETLLDSGALPLPDAYRLLEQIVSALDAAHRKGVVHRDLKPANILLDEDGNAYLSDFGIAKALGIESGVTLTGAIVGTPAYITPEQVQSQPVSSQTDIYSLGVMLFAMLTGEHPFPDSTSGELLVKHVTTPLPPITQSRPDLPPELDSVIQRATAKDPAERYPDVLALLADFRQVIGVEIAPLPITDQLLEVANPYKGLRPFQEADALDFFGRQTLTDRLLARLTETGEYARFLAVVGPSGSGKSSVVKAGLIPRLRQGTLPSSDQWFITEMLPGAHPLEELELALLRIAVHQPPSLLGQLKEDKRGLLRAVRRILPEGSQMLLLVDQFEEVFTQTVDKTEARHFMDSMYAAVTDPNSPLRVVLTLRADFYDRPLMLPDFSALVQERTEVVVPLTSEELEQAIRFPTERVGGVLEEGLVTTIIADVVEQPGALPLLQYALTELFERREGRLLTSTAYHSIGGVLGALGGRSEEIYQGLDAGQARVARQVFLRLVALGEGVEDTRRRVLHSELDALVITDSAASSTVVDSILEEYGQARLLSFDRNPLTRGPTVEVAHEALLREWGRLREWLDESRADIRMERVLGNAANEWQEADQDESFLLHGSRLDQFEAWVDTTDLALTHTEQEYLDASLAERQAQREAEAERQAREAALERRSRNFLRALVGVFALAAVVAVFLSLYAFNQANLATSRELANAAINNLEVDPELSVLLAMQGLDTAYTLEAENALHTAVLALHLLRTLEGQTEIVQSVAVSPDGNRVAGVGLDGSVIVWDAASGQELIKFKAHDEHTFSVTFSPDGKQIATASEDKTAKIWNAESGEELFTLWGHSDAVNAVIFSPDERFIATASADATVKVWDSASGETLFTLSGHTPAPRSASLHPGGVIDIAFNQDSTKLVSGGADGIAILWDVITGEMLFTLSDQHSNETFVAINPDGSRLATAGTEGLVKVWDLASESLPQAPLLTINHEQAARSLAFSPDGTRLAAASEDGFARVWDAFSGQRLLTLVGHAGLIDDVAFTPDGAQLVTSSEDKTVKVWDLSPGEEWFTVDGSLPFYNPDGTKLATDFNGITLRDSVTGQALASLPISHVPFINHAVFSPDGTRIATGSWDGTAKVWQADNGQELFTVSGHTDRVWEVNFSPDGSRLVTASHDGTAKVWDANSGSELFTLSGHIGSIQGVAYSLDGTRIATSSWDDTAKIWDAKTGRELFTLNAGADLTDVAFSPDGNLLAAGGNNAAVTVWDISSGEGQKLFTLIGHTGLIPRLTFSPDGKYIASASFDGSVKLWDVSTGEEWLTLTAGREPVTDVAFNSDGTRLATGGFEGRVRVYALKLEDLQGIAKSRLTRSLTEQECRKYLHRETCP